MSNVIKPARRILVEEFELSYEYPGTGCGFSFPCDRTGVVDETFLSDGARKNLETCRAGEGGVVSRGVIDYTRTIKEPAVIRCGCGQRVELDDAWLNSCDHCGRDYNGFGNLLAPRSQWGEETGEIASDMVIASRLPGDDF